MSVSSMATTYGFRARHKQNPRKMERVLDEAGMQGALNQVLALPE